MEEIDLKELFSLFWSKKIHILFIILFFIFIGGIYSYFFVVPEYTAVTNLVLIQDSTVDNSNEYSAKINSTDITMNSMLVSTYSEIIKEDIILGEVAKNLNLEYSEVEKVRNKISVSYRDNTEIIEIKVRDIDPKFATNIATEIANVFSKKIVDIYKINNIYMLDKAKVPTVPSNINHVKDIMIFSIIGIAISTGYIIILYMLDNTVKSESDIEKATNSVILISIPSYDSGLKKIKGGKI